MRVKGGPRVKNRRKKVQQLTEGFRGRIRNTNKLSRQSAQRKLQSQYRHRKEQKRLMRALWIHRINAAAQNHGASYSRLMGALRKQEIMINRKMLADLAATEPKAFEAVVRASGL